MLVSGTMKTPWKLSETAPKISNNSNSFSFYLCDNGDKVSALVICDSRKDCADGSDEKNCRKYTFIFINLLFLFFSSY